MGKTTRQKVVRYPGRPKTKGAPIPFKFRPDCEEWLRDKADRENKTMVRILEDLIDAKRVLKAGAA